MLRGLGFFFFNLQDLKCSSTTSCFRLSQLQFFFFNFSVFPPFLHSIEDKDVRKTTVGLSSAGIFFWRLTPPSKNLKSASFSNVCASLLSKCKVDPWHVYRFSRPQFACVASFTRSREFGRQIHYPKQIDFTRIQNLSTRTSAFILASGDLMSLVLNKLCQLMHSKMQNPVLNVANLCWRRCGGGKTLCGFLGVKKQQTCRFSGTVTFLLVFVGAT